MKIERFQAKDVEHEICTILGSPGRRKRGLEPFALRILGTAILAVFLYIPLSYAGQFKMTRVYDGDTVKAEGHDTEIMVRLVGIDAPETSRKKHEPGQPFSQQATKHLAGLVLNKIVDIQGYGMDRYNRILGVIFLDGKNVNLEMVEMGLAEVYDGRPPRGFDIGPYLQAEKEAREAKRGMWVQGDEYISPREWRRMALGG